MIKINGPALGKLAPDMGAAPGAKGPKPAIRLRKIHLGGKSAYPQGGAAFGTPDQSAASPAAAFSDSILGAAGGDTGA